MPMRVNELSARTSMGYRPRRRSNHCSPHDKDDAIGNLFHTSASINVRSIFAGIAQLVEQLICNQQVVGSNPTAGSFQFRFRFRSAFSKATADKLRLPIDYDKLRTALAKRWR